ncbi:unnamed protein product, partial [Mesorhabditis spiculigera]
MEADEYFRAYEAMKEEEEAGCAERLPLKISDPCGITKIVWSSFDFMSGPALKYVWDVVHNDGLLTPVNLSGEEFSETHSLNESSLSANSVQFEDIDDPLKHQLLTTSDEIQIDTGLDIYNSSPILTFKGGMGQFLDDYMTDSRSTATEGTNTIANTSMISTLTSPQYDSPNQSSPVDPVVEELHPASEPATVSTSHSSGNTVLSRPDPEPSPLIRRAVCMDESVDGQADDEFSDEQDGNRLPELMSCFDSGIAGTTSTHSDLSAFCNSPAAQATEKLLELSIMENSIFKKRYSTDGEESEVHLDPPDDQPSDESFIAKFVLAEQICSTQLPSNPLIVKITCVPDRSLLAVSFLFSLPWVDSDEDMHTMNAFSLLMAHKKLEWFMQREQVFEGIMSDIVPRVKASLLEEDFEDSIIRMTTEFTHLLNFFGSLERYPLLPNGILPKVRQTLLSGVELGDNKLLTRAISGVLQSQGFCVVIGDDPAAVAKMLHTLALFIPAEFRWNCLRSQNGPYSPYVRLQTVPRQELPEVVLHGAGCEWPLCLIDLDRKKVCLSSSYSKHRLLKRKLDLHGIQSILEQLGPASRSKFRLELSPVKTIECVRWLVRHLELLPPEESARKGLINQFLLFIKNSALALIESVRASSEPLPNEKECGARSAQFSLSDVRKSLDLTNDGLFHAVLAKAELLKPQIAEFIYQ